MAAITHLSIVLLYITLYAIKDVGCDDDVINLNCSDTFIVVSWKYFHLVNFTGLCPEACIKTRAGQVYGTRGYAQFSLICLSAVHDRRVSVEAGQSQMVSFTKVWTDKSAYFTGTYNNGVQSKSTNSTPFFKFTSPRIKERVLDVTSLHRRYLTKTDSKPSVTCYCSSDAVGRSVAIEQLVVDDRGANINPSSYIIPIPKPVGKDLQFKKEMNSRKIFSGAYICSVNSSPVSNVLSVTMPHAANFKPSILTATVSTGEDVLLTMDPASGVQLANASWWQNDRVLTSGPDPTRIRINNVKLENAGFYTLGYRNKADNSNSLGVVRLIVTPCSREKYGPGCRHDCPLCHNGGVCHHLTGDCICPPGFQGDTCDIACGDDRIGRYCTGKCSTSEPPVGDPPTCRGVSICLPDPYGCSCGVGYKGLDCTMPCGENEYGAGCRQKRWCHCGDGRRCNPFTGRCLVDTCKDGWTRAPYCDVEELVDVTSLHRNYLLKRDEKHEQVCFVAEPDKNQDVTFREYPGNRINPAPSLPVFRPIPQNSKDGKFYVMDWNKNGYDGGFICSVDGNPMSTITSMILYTDANMIPRVLTKTVNFGDTVTLKMMITEDGANLSWHFNEKNLVGYGAELTLKDVTTDQTGLYTLNSWTSNRRNHGVIRLIVRKCIANRYGPHCDLECPKCENGGICSDVNGLCLCPPGFMGANCQIACGADRIGRSCTGTCSESGPEGGDKSCRGVLICLPDPYGCSCGTGFKGLNCSQECTSGSYGAGCSQFRDCHCQNSTSCEAASGHCGNALCQNGWINHPFCDTMSPVLREPPKISNVTDTAVTVHWKAWNIENGDFGVGEAAGYIVKYKLQFSNVWYVTNPVERTNDKSYQLTLTLLNSSSSYVVKVLVQDVSGSVQDNATTSFFSTQCSDPIPQNVRVKEEDVGKVKILWENPEPDVWKCKKWKGSYKVRIQSNVDDFGINTVKTEASYDSYPYVLWTITVSGSSRGDLDKQVQITYRSRQTAPSQVRSVTTKILSPTSFNVSWKEPERKNGILLGYRVDHKQIGWRHDCKTNLDYTNYFKNTTSAFLVIEGVRPSSKYRVRIRGRTVTIGEKVVHMVLTPPGVPNASPKQFQENKEKKQTTQLELTWSSISCSDANGEISSYKITYWSLSSWDNTNLSSSTNRNGLVLRSLHAYTTYDIRIRAVTSAGQSFNYSRVAATTLPDAPPGPTSLVANEKTVTTISLSWKPPHPPNGELELYKVKFNSITNLVKPEEVICPKRLRDIELHCYKIEGLRPRLNYTISIKAKNKKVRIWGRWSDEIVVQTEESIPDAPEDLAVINSTMNSVLISWKQPFNTNGKLLAYKIILMSKNSLKDVFEKSANDDTILKLTKLEPAQYYEVSISANTSKGFGPAAVLSIATSIGAPPVDFKPKVGSVTDTSVSITISPASDVNGPISDYYVLVFEMDNAKDDLEDIQFNNFTMSKHNRLSYYVAARLSADKVTSTMRVDIGNGIAVGGYENPALKTGKSYEFGLAVISQFNGEKKVSMVKTGLPVTVIGEGREPVVSDVSISLIVIFVLFVMLLALAAVYFVHRRNHIKFGKKENVFKLRATHNVHNISRDSLLQSTMTLDVFETDMNGILNEPSSLVTVERFPEYLQEKLADGSLVDDFDRLDSKPLKSQEICKLPQNRNKNRYKVLLPYDETRVILNKVDDDEFSDYINASYISGYDNKKKVYIATQGPKKNTCHDFWRMVWDENTRIIIMVTNLVENGKVKCDQYWPENSEQFGDILVKFVGVKVQAEYTIRTFQVSRDSAPRLVRHLHFTGWPDHSAPMYTTTLVAMLKEVKRFNSPEYGPIITHCSAGVGRTGTVILLDAMLKMAEKSQQIDFLRFVSRMRSERVHMVQNETQYIFAHNALLEALYGTGTCIPSNNYIKQLEKLRTVQNHDSKTALQHQFENINKLTARMSKEECRTSVLPININKNRCEHILPLERCRPFLSMSNDGSCYINAVYVNGYKKKNAFILTQMPLPSTIDDFWVCVYDTDTCTIVLLNEFPNNDETCKPYWSTKLWICGKISVEMISEEDENLFFVRTFTICNTTKASEKPRTLKLFHLKRWTIDAVIPPSVNGMIELMEEVDRWQQQSGNKTIICQCFNGATACGIYTASKFLCDKLKEEQNVDVFLSVRNVRSNRSSCIQNEEQYDFLHQLAYDYLEGFQTYANFK